MFALLLVCTVFGASLADVSHLFNTNPYGAASRPIAILRQSQDIQPDGSYQYSYETENGIAAEERGQERILSADQSQKSAQGSFQWISPEGEQVSVSYVADGNGYQPQGSHLPVAPPIPPAIQRALDWIAAQPQQQRF